MREVKAAGSMRHGSHGTDTGMLSECSVQHQHFAFTSQLGCYRKEHNSLRVGLCRASYGGQQLLSHEWETKALMGKSRISHGSAPVDRDDKAVACLER